MPTSTDAQTTHADTNSSDRQADRPENSSPGESTAPSVAHASREERIRMAAYAASERRGFAPGFETQDWLDAERQIDQESKGDSALASAR